MFDDVEFLDTEAVAGSDDGSSVMGLVDVFEDDGDEMSAMGSGVMDKGVSIMGDVLR